MCVQYLTALYLCEGSWKPWRISMKSASLTLPGTSSGLAQTCYLCIQCVRVTGAGGFFYLKNFTLYFYHVHLSRWRFARGNSTERPATQLLPLVVITSTCCPAPCNRYENQVRQIYW